LGLQAAAYGGLCAFIALIFVKLCKTGLRSSLRAVKIARQTASFLPRCESSRPSVWIEFPRGRLPDG
jgi:hypothetical protein